MNSTLLTILQCAALSMLPVVELRGALPWAVAHGLDPWLSYGLCVICNMIPIPFILLFINKILDWMETTRRFSGVARWVKEHGQKRQGMYHQYKLLGLFLLVAVPLPGTGAWTGALVASLMGLRMKQAVPTIALGVAAAGILVLLVSLGVVSVLG